MEEEGLFENFGNWVDGAEWRAKLFYAFLAMLALLIILSIFALTVCGGYWFGLGVALLFESGEAFRQGLPLLTMADLSAHLSITFTVWCIIAYHQVINHPKVEVLEGGMLFEQRTWPNHSFWFYLIFALLLPTIAGFVAAVW